MRASAVNQQGFSLLEALVAMAILAIVLLTFLGTRTDALIDAAEARNWRIAQEIAQEVMSELSAGARDMPVEAGIETDLGDDHPGFSYVVFQGEDSINRFETERAGMSDWGSEQADRLAWQRERNDLRAASRAGVSLTEYREDQLKKEAEEEQVPSEEDYEDVMVVVYFPDIRPGERNQGRSTFTLKAKLSTLALSCRTPEEAERIASLRGESESSSTSSGNTTNTGTSPGTSR
jgi:prepilin-type N-terminal cleavage/methylation domain-containing protein